MDRVVSPLIPQAIFLVAVMLLSGGAGARAGSPALRAKAVEKPLTLEMPFEAWKTGKVLELEGYDATGGRQTPWYARAEVYVGWDAKNLYVAAEVWDRDHLQKATGEKIWDGDSIQFALVRGDDWREFALARTPEGPQPFYWKIRLVPHNVIYETKEIPANVAVAVERDGRMTRYRAILPAARLGLDALEAGTEWLFNLALFDRSAGGNFLDNIPVRPGLLGTKDATDFLPLRLAEAKGYRDAPLYAGRGSLLGAFSFETEEKRPTLVHPSGKRTPVNLAGLKDVTVTLTDEDAYTGEKSIKILRPEGTKGRAVIGIGTLEGLESGKPYTLTIYGRAEGKPASQNGIRVNPGGMLQIKPLPQNKEWTARKIEFMTPKDGKGTVWCSIEVPVGEGAYYLDHLTIREGWDSVPEPEDKQILLLSDDLSDPRAYALMRLFPGISYPMDIDAFDAEKAAAYERIALILGDPAPHLETVRGKVLPLVREKGKTLVADLAVYAPLFGAEVETIRVPDVDHLAPVEAQLPKGMGWREIRKAMDEKPEYRKLLEERRLASLAEENETIPSVRVVTEAPMAAGYPVGSVVPWCRREEGTFIQHRLAAAPEREGVTVVAVSTDKNKPVWLTETVGKGTVVALDQLGRDEPFSDRERAQSWDLRGVYNKYVPLCSALGRPPQFGVYWTRRPTISEYYEKMRALCDAHPALEMTVEGYHYGYPTYGYSIGTVGKPVLLFTGLVHHGGEWESGLLGLYSTAKYLAEHADEPRVRQMLENVHVKMIPIVNPDLYVKHVETPEEFLKGKHPKPERDEARRKREGDVVLNFQMHHGVGTPDTSFGTTFSRGQEWNDAIEATMRKMYRPVSLYYSPAGGGEPHLVGNRSQSCACPPSWDGYFTHPVDVRGLYYHSWQDILTTGRLLVLSENSVFGRSPAAHHKHDYLSYRSLVVSDVSASVNVAAVLTPMPDSLSEPYPLPERIKKVLEARKQ